LLGSTEGFFDAATGAPESGEQICSFALDQVINMDHALVKLARTIDWRFWRRIWRRLQGGPGQPPLRLG